MIDTRLFSDWAKHVVAENHSRRERCRDHYPWEEGCWPTSDVGAIEDRLRREPSLSGLDYAIRREGDKFTIVVRDGMVRR